MRIQDSHAYAGKILRVDLNSRTTSIEPTVNYARDWLGGSGIGVWILYNEVKPRVTAYSPANRLIFGAGALVGTLTPGASRLSVDSKNAKTSGIGTSNSDSHFAPELKFAGYDSIVFQGKARTPVYLWINDDRVQVRNAAHLWGKTTWETVDSIRSELGDEDIQVVSIGPAGENIVPAACIIQGKGRAMGRCGTGSVMGSKTLKAVAVRGSGSITIADPARFMNAVDEARKLFEQCPTSAKFMQFGTPGLISPIQDRCGIPYKNCQNFQLPAESFNKLRTDIEKRKYMVRNLGYMGCPAPCGHSYAIDQGPYTGLKTEGFQFEALSDFAGRLAVDDLGFVIKANAYANQLGLDIDNSSIPIAWAMECFQRGILGKDDLDGLEPGWGNTEAILELMRRIAWREGIGNILGEGCAHAAEVFGKGSEYYAQNIKGQDLFEVCRGDVGWSLGVCTATRGGTHTTGAPFCEKSFEFNKELAKRVYEIPTSVNVVDYEGKANLVSFYEKLTRIDNCLGICLIDSACENPVLPSFPEIAEIYSAATGWETTIDDLKRTATRILNVEKAFNLLHTNFDRKDDYPTQRDLEEPIPSGPKKGWKLDRERWDSLLDEYYEMHNWDKKTGFPTRKCLEDLGLREVAKDLEKAGKLGGVDI
jgi:aldehyde:ferredoxin oxidoreductase